MSTGDTGKVCIAPWARTRITLGLGMKFPAAREKPQDLVFKFWMKSSYTRREKGPSTRTRGQRGGDEENINQTYIEEVLPGQLIAVPVSGPVAAKTRDVAHHLCNSLLWSGQAAPTWGAVGFEAKAYVYNVLAEHFNFILYCEGGIWKMDMLMTQIYPVFWQNRGSAASIVDAVKHEPRSSITPAAVPPEKRSASEDWYTTPAPNSKRLRNTPALSTSPHLSSAPLKASAVLVVDDEQAGQTMKAHDSVIPPSPCGALDDAPVSSQPQSQIVPIVANPL